MFDIFPGYSDLGPDWLWVNKKWSRGKEIRDRVRDSITPEQSKKSPNGMIPKGFPCDALERKDFREKDSTPRF